ncbi:MAG: hypothetical protein VX028_01810 [Nanoarchaeota archaeon]|nr:hypothetical protein [Nanoarchaeota archaeon]
MTKINSLSKTLGGNKKINAVFLGIGLTIFLINISSFLTYLPVEYSEIAFDISVFSSMIIILVAVYNLHEKK